MDLLILLFFGSLVLNCILFSMLIFLKEEGDKYCNNDIYKYDAANRKLYVNDELYRTFTINSCNHKVFSYILENQKSDYLIAEQEIYESNRDWSIKSTLYNLSLPSEFIIIRATSYELLANVEII